MALMRSNAALVACAVVLLASAAGHAAPPPAQATAPSPGFKPGADAPTDVWIFSGELNDSHETFSGTLVANKGDAEFELKLGDGATCDGSQLSGEVGLVRLPEITCSDSRTMRALFVPQGGQALKVFGHVGDQRFESDAHLLGNEAPPEPGQTAEPTVPALQGRPGALPKAPAPPR